MSNILGKTDFKNYNSPAYENKFYKIMVEYLGDEIFVTDGNGKIIFVNPASVDVIGLPVDKIIGRTAQELQDEGYFSVSSTMEVLRKKKSVNVLQKLQNGKTVLATGVPVFDKNQEEIIMVISTCCGLIAISATNAKSMATLTPASGKSILSLTLNEFTGLFEPFLISSIKQISFIHYQTKNNCLSL
jgi:PAS domain S-box-containing protein